MSFFDKTFTKEFLLSGNRLAYCCNRLPVENEFEKIFKLNLQRSKYFQKAVIDYNVLVIDY